MEGRSLAEWLLPLSLAADPGAALPPGTGARTALLALRAGELQQKAVEPAELCFGGLLRHLGCSATAHEETKLMGDERELRSSFALVDAASPPAMVRAAGRGFGKGKSLPERARRVTRFVLSAPRAVPRIFSDRCHVAKQLAARLGLPPGVQHVLTEAYERFDGKGTPAGTKGDALSVASRILAAAELVATCSELPGGSEMARDLLEHRRGTQFDPDVVEAFVKHWAELTARLEMAESLLLEVEPAVKLSIDLGDASAFALAFADFTDLKSPFTLGHSRNVALLAERAAKELGLPAADQQRLFTAGLLHDLGRVSVSNAIWDKPGPLDERERELMRGHAAFTERILARSGPWQSLATLAASDHERGDGSGYPRTTLAPNVGMPARLLAASDVFVALGEPRPHRPAFESKRAVEVLREEAARGRLDRSAVDAVLASCGLLTKGERTSLPKGISERELEVLRLLARGLVDKEIAEQLGISHRTVHHHNQSLFQKIGVTTRGAAALFAIENGLV